METTDTPRGEGPATPPPPDDGTRVPPPPPPPEDDPGATRRPSSLGELRRRPDDRVIGGVAASIARALDLDPVIIRIAFVVLALFGGSGIVLYLVAWALIPEAPDDRSWALQTLEGGNGVLGVILLGLGALIAIPVLGRLLWWGPWDGRGSGVLVPLALITVGIVLIARGDRGEPVGPAGPSGGPGGPGGPGSWPAPDPGTATSPAPGAAPWAAAGPAVAPRRRPSSIVTPVTLSVALIALGLGIGAHQAGWVTLGAADVIAGLLVVIGVGLLVGAIRGGARGLIAPGIVLALALGPALVVDSPIWSGAGQRDHAPVTIDQLRPTYRLGAGSLRLDLRGLQLDGADRRVEIGVTLGEVEVIAPRDARVTVDARSGVGEVQVFGRSQDGFRPEIVDSRPALDPTGDGGTLELVVEVGVGQVVVR